MSFILEQVKNGKDLILYNTHKYRESYPLISGDIVWRCLGRTCKASITTNNEKSAIYSCKEKHSGSHPKTMRALTPILPQRKHSALPTADLRSPLPTTPLSTPSMSVHDDTASHELQDRDELNTLDQADLEAENNTLRQELATVRAERQVMLNHSIESDLRLLQYTDNVFLSPVPTTQNSNTPTSNELDKLKKELDDANNTIRSLERIIATLKEPCNSCVAQREETKNMIESIRCLEKEIESLITTKVSPGTGTSSATNGNLNNRYNVLTDSLLDAASADEGFITVVRKNKPQYNKEKPKINKHKKTIKNKTKPETKTVNVPYHNVTVVGDSHARHIASLMGPMVDPSTRMSGVCKPGAGLLNIAPTSTPPPRHCYIIMAGTNDVANGGENVIFDQMEGVMRRCLSSSDMLIMPLTPRYDLPANSPIHRTIERVNHHLRELCRRYEGVNMLDISGINRRLYTSHGLHLRASGKRVLARLIVEKLALMKQRPPPTRQPPQHTACSAPERTHPITLQHNNYAAAVVHKPKTVCPIQISLNNSVSFLGTQALAPSKK